MLNALDKGSSYSQQLENKNNFLFIYLFIFFFFQFYFIFKLYINFLKEIWLQLGLKREVFQRAVCHMDREEGYEKE